MHKLSLADRLKHLRESKNISQEQLASGTEMTTTQIRDIEENSDATIQELIQISTYFKADLNWFILGMDFEQVNMDYLVLIDQNAAAGYLDNKDDPAFFSQLEYYRIPGFQKSGNHRIFLVQGDSMYPTISETDYLVCSEVGDTSKLENGDLAVFVTADGVVVKRVRFDKGLIILESDNPKYKAFTLEEKSVSEVWKVEAKVTKLIEDFTPGKSEDQQQIANTLKEMKDQLNDFKGELDRINGELKKKK